MSQAKWTCQTQWSSNLCYPGSPATLIDVLIGSLDATILGVMSVAWYKVWSSGTRAGQLNSLFLLHQWLHVYTRRLKPVIVSRFYKAIPDPEASILLMFSILVYYTFSIFLIFMIEYNSVLQSETQSLQGFKDPSLWRQTSKTQMGQKWTHVASMLCIRYDPLSPNRFDQLWLTPAKDRKIKRKRLRCFVSFPGWKSVSTKKDG